jgi:uncharacterized protein (DUF342 family)
MRKPDDYSLEDLVDQSEGMLKGLEDIEALAGELPDELGEKITGEFRKKFLESHEEAPDTETDGYAELTVSDDEMRVAADFHPPGAGKKSIELDYVAQLLKSKGITYGVDWNAIKEAVLKCNTEKVEISEAIIARGKKPINGVPERWVIEESYIDKESSLSSEHLRVDFRKVSPFVLVKEGEVLARLSPRKPGTEGSTVLGKYIPYGIAKIIKIEPGRNTRREGNRIVAGCAGRFEHDEKSFWINRILEIENDIDYSTGHIDFPGDVVIKGQIKDGFKVNSGGSVFCNNTMDASEVHTDKDLVVRLGLIGRKRGAVKVGGKLRAKFIENCYVEAGDSIYVEVGILNSSVHTSNRIELGEKGMIVGGEVHAQNGINAAQIGTQMGPRTEIYCGTDYSVEQKLEWIRDKNVELALKLKQVRLKLKTPSPVRKRLLGVHEKIKNAIHRLNEAAASLVSRLDRNEEAEIKVSGFVFPGVYIEICHTSYIVKRTMRNLCFKLDKQKGTIATEPLMMRK